MKSTRLKYLITALLLSALACGQITTATPPPEGESGAEPATPTETSSPATPSPSPEVTPTSEQQITPSPTTAAESSPFGLLAVQAINKLAPGAAETFLDSMGFDTEEEYRRYATELAVEMGAAWARVSFFYTNGRFIEEATELSLLREHGFSIIATIQPVRKTLPDNMDVFLQAVRDLVEEYDWIKIWHIANEPDLTWDNPDEYAPFFIATREAVLSVCPDCQIALAGISNQFDSTSDNYLIFDSILADIAAAGIEHPFDIFDFHFFRNAGDYATAPDTCQLYRDLLARHGLDEGVSLWVTEMATYSGKPVGNFPPQSEADQANELVKRYVVLLNCGVERAFWGQFIEWYKYLDLEDGYFDHTGLVYNGLGEEAAQGIPGGTKKPGFYAYQTTARMLTGYTAVEQLSEGPALSQVEGLYRFTFADRQPVYVLWSEVETTLALPGVTGEVVVTHIDGSQETADAAALPASPSPIFVSTTAASMAETPPPQNQTAVESLQPLRQIQITSEQFDGIRGELAFAEGQFFVVYRSKEGRQACYFLEVYDANFEFSGRREQLACRDQTYGNITDHRLIFVPEISAFFMAYERAVKEGESESHALFLVKYDANFNQVGEVLITTGIGPRFGDEFLDDPAPVYSNGLVHVITKLRQESSQEPAFKVYSFDTSLQPAGEPVSLSTNLYHDANLAKHLSAVSAGGSNYLVTILQPEEGNLCQPDSAASELVVLKFNADWTYAGWYKVLTVSQEVELSPLGFKYFEDRFYITYVATDNPQCFSGHFASGSVYLKVYEADFDLLQEAEVLQQVQDETRGFHPAVEVTGDRMYIIYTTIEGDEAGHVYVSEFK